MRNITKNIQFQIDGTPMDFRLTKLDAFSGAELLRMLAGIPAGGGDAGETVSAVFASLPSPDLRNLMTSCLKLTVEEVLWTLEGFFGGSGPASRPAARASTPVGPRT